MTGPITDQWLDEIAAHVPNCRYGCEACEAFPVLAEEIRRLRALTADAAGYLAVIHRHANRHDVLGADLGCAGCTLLNRIEGASESTLTRIKAGKRPDADGLVSLLVWLGRGIEDFTVLGDGGRDG